MMRVTMNLAFSYNELSFIKQVVPFRQADLVQKIWYIEKVLQ